MKRIRSIFTAILLLSAFSMSYAKTQELIIMTHDSFAVSKDLFKQFEEENNVKIKILKCGDAGAALNQAILSKKHPLGDVFFGVDNTFMGRALNANIFISYKPINLEKIPESLRLDPTNCLVPVDFGDVCLNIDKNWFASHDIQPPTSLDDLINPQFKGLVVVENPATSSPGLAFLLATIGNYGENGFIDYWKKLKENDVYVSKGWTDAYYGQFSHAKSGDRPIVVSYASSPAAEVFYSETKNNECPTSAISNSETAFRQIEFVGILKGTKNKEVAKRLVDFMLSDAFQQDIPLNMWVFPAVKNTPLPPVFVQHAKEAENPIKLTPVQIDTNRERWIELWTRTVLR